jgi:serine/threonine protein kinase
LRQQHIWIRGIAEALHHIHTANILHRDIKPMNIFMEDDEWQTPLIADFGIAVPLRGGSLPGRPCIGTPGFRAPEVELQKEYGYPSDIWSFGATAYCIIRGTTSLPDKLQIGDNQLEHLISRCLDRDPSRRPTSLQLRDEIQRLTDVGDFAEYCKPITDPAMPQNVFPDPDMDERWLEQPELFERAALSLGRPIPYKDGVVDWDAAMKILEMYIRHTGADRRLVASLKPPRAGGCFRSDVKWLKAAHPLVTSIDLEEENGERFFTFVCRCPPPK